MEVDRRISFPAIFIALIWSFFRGNFELYLIGAFIGFMFYVLQYWITKFIYKYPGVGMGDFELGLLMGLILGWKLLLPAIFLSYIIGLIVAIPILIFSKLKKNTPKINGQLALPMGAFLMPSLLLFMYAGESILNWYWGLLGGGF